MGRLRRLQWPPRSDQMRGARAGAEHTGEARPRANERALEGISKNQKTKKKPNDNPVHTRRRGLDLKCAHPGALNMAGALLSSRVHRVWRRVPCVLHPWVGL